MKLTSQEMLRQLGNGDTIAKVCESAGVDRSDFDAWWRAECERRVPSAQGTRAITGLERQVRIERDTLGIPHIHADTERDLFFGFGYATAQDRLFQLDYLRRKARGRLAEILGPEALDSDLLHRTVGLAQIAEKEWTTLPGAVRNLLSAYTAGINALMEASRGCLPIEYDLLGYEPEPWRESDSLAIIGEFRWYLTGRFPVIAIPELVKRAVGDGPLYKEFILAEIDDECIMQAGEYPAALTGRAGAPRRHRTAATTAPAATTGCSTAIAPIAANRSSPTIRIFPTMPSPSGMKFGCTAASTWPASLSPACPES